MKCQHTIICGPLALADGKPLPLSKAVRAGHYVLLSGQLGLDAHGGLAGADIESQTRQCFENIKTILHDAGCDLSQVVKATVWLTERADFARFNAVYAEQFPHQPPARSTVCSGLMYPGALIEMEVLAYDP